MSAPTYIELIDRRLLAVSGTDRYDFLNNLITQNCVAEHMPALSAAALLTPQGKLLDEFLVWHDDDRLIIDCAIDRGPDIVQKLSLYKLRSKIDIAPLDGHPYASLTMAIGPIDPRHSDLGYRSLSRPSAGTQMSLDIWHKKRLALGIAEGPRDMPPGAEFPLEFVLDKTHAIDFKKGCFIGQEVTSRSFRRGSRRKALFPAVPLHRADADEPASGQPVIPAQEVPPTHDETSPPDDAPTMRQAIFDADQRRVGEVIASLDQHMLILLRLDAVDLDLHLEKGGRVQRLDGLFDPSQI